MLPSLRHEVQVKGQASPSPHKLARPRSEARTRPYVTALATHDAEEFARMTDGSAGYQVYVLEIAPGALAPGIGEKLPSRTVGEGRQWFYVGITTDLGKRLDQHLQGEDAWTRYRDELEQRGKKPRVRPVQPFKALSELRDGAALKLGEDVLQRPDLISGGNRFETKERAEKAETRTSRRLRAQRHEVFGDK